MCPDCPRCNYGDNFTPCQDKFGNNMRPMGGSAGGMNAIGGGTEHQAVGTPHLHAQGHVVCMYQYDTLQEVADRIRAGFVNYQSVVDYQSWFHREEVMDMKEHDAYADQAEDEFRTRLSAPSNHRLAQTPWYLCEDVLTKQSEKTLWAVLRVTWKVSWKKVRLSRKDIFVMCSSCSTDFRDMFTDGPSADMSH